MSENIINLGIRLKTIASYVPEGSLLGDIGTDHAYLPIYLVQKKVINMAVGVEINTGPYKSALESVKMHSLQDRIEVRHGNGLVPLKRGEVDTLSIAGMGGFTILEILSTRPDVLAEVKSLVLQPQGGEDKVRRELLTKGWLLQDELLVEEDGRIYTVMYFVSAQGVREPEELANDIERERYIDTNTNKNKNKNIVQSEKMLNRRGLNFSDVENEIRKLEKELTGRIIEGDEDKNFTSKVLTNEINTFLNRYVWILGPIIIHKKGNLLEALIEENIISCQRIFREMQKADREEIKSKAREVNQETKIWEVMKKWLYQ